MKELQYSSAIKEWSLMFEETRKTAILLSEGKSEMEILELSKGENIYQLSKEIRRTKLPQKIMVRLGALNNEQIKMVAFGNDLYAKFLILIAIMKTDRLFFEFMREVYAESMEIGHLEIADKDFNVFFEKKAQESAVAAKWKTDTLEKIRNAYKRLLVDALIGSRDGTILTIKKALCEKDALIIMREGNDVFADTFLPY